MKDDEIMLMALSKEREQLHEQLMQVDRIIKKIRTGEYLASNDVTAIEIMPSNRIEQQPDTFPMQANLKVQVLRVLDIIGQATTLKDIHNEFIRLTSKNYNLRETVRSLHQSKLVMTVKEKDAQRSIFWVKTDWVEDGQLLDNYKPEGFDLLYKADNLEYK